MSEIEVSDTLRTWKEIARYLGCGVRTAQRYEHFNGLPVRRQFARKGSSVMAFPKDLDSWLQQARTKRAHPETIQTLRDSGILELHHRTLVNLYGNLTKLCEHVAEGRRIRTREHWFQTAPAEVMTEVAKAKS